MRKIFDKVMVGTLSLALVATLAVGVNTAKNVNAGDTPEPVEVTYSNWSFSQGGQYVPSQAGNEGYIDSVVMNGTNETISGWLRGNGAEGAANNPSVGQTQSATQASKGFDINIANTGWDAMWDFSPYRINPWSIQAFVDVPAIPGHNYKVEFTASADEKKYAYFAVGGKIKGDDGSEVDIAPYEGDVISGNKQVVALGTTSKTFTYTFTNWVGLDSFKTTVMLGAFDAQQDQGGNDISDIVTAVENGWHGHVYVSDFTVTDLGLNPEYVEVPTKWEDDSTAAPATTKKPVEKTTKKAVAKVFAQVTKVKAKNNKKGKITVSWKKVTGAKKYQIKIGTKKYTSKVGAKKLVAKGTFKKGKTYKVKVRALAANGYKAGKFSKTVKVKIKK